MLKLEKEIIIGALGLIIGYFILKLITRKQKTSTHIYSDMSELQSNSEHAHKSKNSFEFLGHENPKDSHKSTISDILTNDKYKVKGQWDK